MISKKKGEARINYLLRVLDDFMHSSGAGELMIEYDDARCDGYCLASDIAAELIEAALKRKHKITPPEPGA